jgi:hypothetical protein
MRNTTMPSVLRSGFVEMYSQKTTLSKLLTGLSTLDKGISGSGYKKLEHENVQFSVQAKLGAALTLYKQTELYLEPHIAYYIENNSSIHNIWKDKPFNFGLTLGIRTGF